MSKVLSLFSGSNGNSFLVSCNNENILVDCGVCCKSISQKLDDFGVSSNSISAVLLTHEHIDHIKGVKLFCDKYNIPLYATNGTLKELDIRGLMPLKSKINEIHNKFVVGEFEILTFETPHDARESVGYVINTADGKKISVCTDLGHINEKIKNSISGSNFVYLESNHDIEMLKNGSYPAHLKQRILGMFGHLSNKACDDFAVSLIETGTTRLMLGHISQENNSVPLALSCAKKTLLSNGMIENRDFLISAADVDGNGKFCVI